MIRTVCVFVFFGFSFSVGAQIRLTKLVLKKGEHYRMENSDILVVDTLIMNDSSHVHLYKEKKDIFIHTKVFRIGRGCMIQGAGEKGADGPTGIAGTEQLGPCKPGGPGQNAKDGVIGNPGKSLSIYSNEFTLTGSLTINLNGGEGGNGGKGGNGGGGGPGTRVCAGGNGGGGGNGGNGANGGDGGNLLIQYSQGADLHLMLGRLFVVKNFGGFAGQEGDAGQGGSAGLGTLRDGKNGSKGLPGKAGEAGKVGLIKLEKK